VICQQLRADAIPFVATPLAAPLIPGEPPPPPPSALQTLALRGVSFGAAVTPEPAASAALGSLLTGRLPSGHSVSPSDPVPALLPGYVTLPEILRAQGYATRAFVGSEGLARGPTLWQGCEVHPQRAGLMEAPAAVRAWTAGLPAGTPWLAIVVADEAAAPYGEANHRPRAVGELEPLHLLGAPASHAHLFLHSRAGHAYAREHHRKQGGEAAVAAYERSIRRFLWQPPESDAGVPAYSPAAFAREARAAYEAGAQWVDTLIGSLDESLGLAKQGGSTVTILASTGGTAFGEHGILGPGLQLYDEQVRVPLVLVGDGILSGAQPMSLAQPASLVDVLPTVLDLLGLPVLPDADGVSLLPLMRGEAAHAPAVSETHQDGDSTGVPGVRATLVSARSPHWKYIVRLDYVAGTVLEEAYDLRVDPGEQKNLAQQGLVSDVPFDAEMCRAVERIRDGIWDKVAGANLMVDKIYSMGPGFKGNRPRPCGK
jgi:arylsulfatase A-like enzyme